MAELAKERVTIVRCANGYMVFPPEYDVTRDRVGQFKDSFVFNKWDDAAKYIGALFGEA